jgi:hypothetical protein
MSTFWRHSGRLRNGRMLSKSSKYEYRPLPQFCVAHYMLFLHNIPYLENASFKYAKFYALNLQILSQLRVSWRF